MDDQKIENLLNLALDATPEEREKSQSLDIGYDGRKETWEVIVRYSGDLAGAALPDWEIVYLSGGYAIVTLPQTDVDRLAALPQIEYVEKPKRLYFELDAGRAVSCISAVREQPFGLFGRGVLVAVIDSGVDYFHPDFRNEDGSTRIVAVWDQTAAGVPQAGEGAADVPESGGEEPANVAGAREPEGGAPGEDSVVGGLVGEDPETGGLPGGEPVVGGLSGEDPEMGGLSGVEPETGVGLSDEEPVVDGLPGEEPEMGGLVGEEPVVGGLVGGDPVTGRLPGAGRPPAGFRQGVEYTRAQIDEALAAGQHAGYQIVPETDGSGHGTQVLGIAAGNGRSSGGRYRGVAPESDILVVKLGMPREQGFPRTTELMQALEYVVRKAEELGQPIVVNMSFGNVYGSHRGTSLLERYIDMMASRGRSVIAVGTGNEGNTGGHVSGRLSGSQPEEIQLLINEFETSLNLQIWKNYADEYRISVIHPDGRMAGPFGQEIGASQYQLGSTKLLVYYGTPVPYQEQQEIFIDFIPEGNYPYLDSGIWRIVLTPQRIVTGEYEMWLPDSRARGSGTRFLQPAPDTTLTIPSTAANVIAVGAYDVRRNAYASFSGRGWLDDPYDNRPDLVAPGVEITTTASGGGYINATGTSFATPFVTGAAALLMQWGIVDGNDPYLYGEKVRAYLRRGARQLPGFEYFPNNVVGYGALCVRDSLPV